jgi:hypothetical protein
MRDLPEESACKHAGHSAPHTHCRFSYGPCGLHNTMVDASIVPRTGAEPWTSRWGGLEVAMTVLVPIGHSYKQSNNAVCRYYVLVLALLTNNQTAPCAVITCSCSRSILAFGNSGEKTQLGEARHHYDGERRQGHPFACEVQAFEPSHGRHIQDLWIEPVNRHHLVG